MILYVSDKMQNPNHNSEEDKFAMNFGNFDSNGMFNAAHMGGFNIGMKRSAHDAGLDRDMNIGSEEDVYIKKEGKIRASSSRDNSMQQTSLDQQELHHTQQKSALLPNGKKTKGRVKIKMEFIDNKLRRYTTFSKRKTGIMKKAYELSTLTGTQVMLLVASETGHVYTFATRKLQPMITSEAGKALIQTCLNSPDPPPVSSNHHLDQRMSATGYEETELSYAVNEEEHKSPGFFDEYANGSSCSGSESSNPPTPCLSPAHTPNSPLTSSSLLSTSNSGMSSGSSHGGGGGLPLHLGPGLVLAPSASECNDNSANGTIYTVASISEGTDSVPVSLRSVPLVSNIVSTSSANSAENLSKSYESTKQDGSTITAMSNNLPTNITYTKPPSMSGGSMVIGSGGSGLIYSSGSNVVYAPSQDGSAPILFNLPPGLQITQEQGIGSGRKSQMMSLPISMASAAAVVTAAANSYMNSHNSQSLPTDLSLHIKRETNT